MSDEEDDCPLIRAMHDAIKTAVAFHELAAEVMELQAMDSLPPNPMTDEEARDLLNAVLGETMSEIELLPREREHLRRFVRFLASDWAAGRVGIARTEPDSMIHLSDEEMDGVLDKYTEWLKAGEPE